MRFLTQRTLTFVCGTLMLVAGTAHAVSSDFVVRTLIGDDITPPSVPTGLTATPVAMTQIDLSWNASTDDYILSGYQVFRDGLQIASTTLTTYSDIGLSASTTYAYYVTAFDSFNNISASSTLVATTTHATPTPPVITPVVDDDGGTTYGTRVRLPELTMLEVIPSRTGAIIRYETDGYVRSIVRWGTTISYEVGSSAERAFSKVHEVLISDLAPGTRYRFMIEGENERNRRGILTESSFTTLPDIDTTPPGIVTGLTAFRDGEDIVLAWENPGDSDFERVRVLRSESFYPGSETEGWLVYTGGDDETRDVGIALPGKKLFYTVFGYDALGNQSAGAVVSIRIDADGVLPVEVVDPEVNPIELSLDVIRLYQDGELIPRERDTFTTDGGKHLTIAIPYNVLPEHLKTILVTIIPRSDTKKELSFLLRVNGEKTAYTARLAPLGIDGDFLIRVSVFDFKTAQIGYTHGRITSIIHNYIPYEDEREGTSATTIERIFAVIMSNYVVLFVLFLILLAFLARRLLTRE